MKKATLSRRLLAGAAGLAIGLGGLFVVSGPAHATGFSSISFKDNCEATTVTVKIGTVHGTYDAWVEAGGEKLWESDEAGTSSDVVVPAGVGEILAKILHNGNEVLSKTHTWDEPRPCKKLKEPEVTPPTCEESGTITIPDKKGVTYKIDGEVVEPGVHELEPGEYEVTAEKSHYRKLYKRTWVVKIDEPECPDDDPGEGGELPETGSQLALIAGGSLLLLTLGGGLFLVARRRRISFTA